jgi:hypothetical protein
LFYDPIVRLATVAIGEKTAQAYCGSLPISNPQRVLTLPAQALMGLMRKGLAEKNGERPVTRNAKDRAGEGFTRPGHICLAVRKIPARAIL